MSGIDSTAALVPSASWRGSAVEIPTELPAQTVSQQIERSIALKATIEVEPRSPKRRRLAGAVTDDGVALTVRDDSIISRRMSWNVEFEGRIAGSTNGSVLFGIIDVPDRAMLDVLMWAMRAQFLFALVLWVGLGYGTLEPIPLLGDIGFLAIGWIATHRMRETGRREAAVDADLLVRHLRTLLGPGDDAHGFETGT